MPQSYTRLVYHIIYSTKDREPLITDDIKPDLFKYMGGIFRKLDSVAFAINGMPDHVHILAALPPTEAVADIVGKVKSNSSKWIHERWPNHSRFCVAERLWRIYGEHLKRGKRETIHSRSGKTSFQEIV